MTTRRGGAQRIPRPPGTRPGREAPWAHLPPERRRPSVDDVRTALAQAPPPEPSLNEGPGVRPSAVLAPIYEHDGEAWIVLTRRAQHLRAHKGEVSLPGGAEEPGETPAETALREAHEEIALDPATVEIVGELDHLSTISGRSYIVPVVGLLGAPPELVADPGEVEQVIHVSLTELLLDEVFREERWHLGPMERPLYFFELYGDTVWGATARILVNLLCWVTGVPVPPDSYP